MIIVHHLNNSRSQRILWLLEELGLEYDIKYYERDPKTLLAPASLRQVHPLGKSPVITDGTLTVAESGAIIEYLVEQYGGGRLAPPPGTPERLRYIYWLHYAEGSAMPPLLLKLVFDRKAHLNIRSSEFISSKPAALPQFQLQIIDVLGNLRNDECFLGAACDLPYDRFNEKRHGLLLNAIEH